MHALTRVLLMPGRALAVLPVLALGPVALVDERAARRRHGVVALARPVVVPRNAVTRSSCIIALQIAFLPRGGRRDTVLRCGFRGLAFPLTLPLRRLSRGRGVRLITVMTLARLAGRCRGQRLSRGLHELAKSELHRDELLNLLVDKAVIPCGPLAVPDASKDYLSKLPLFQLEDIQLHAAGRGRIHAVTQHQVAKGLRGLVRPDGLVGPRTLEGKVRNLRLRVTIKQVAAIVLLPIELGGSNLRRRVTRLNLLIRVGARIELIHVVRHLLRGDVALIRRLAERVTLGLEEGPNVPQIMRFEQAALIISRQPRIEGTARPRIIIELHQTCLVQGQLHQLDVTLRSLFVLG